MTKKVLYIDDEINGGRAQIEAIKDALEANGLLSVVLCEVDNLEIIISKIQEENAQAVILDLQLDEAANSQGKRVSFKAPTLAQNIREKSIDEKSLDIPIILCSTQQKINNLYRRDISSHDLFDMRFHKDRKDYNLESAKIHSLILGYENIANSDLSFGKMLDTNEVNVDSRLYSHLLVAEQLPNYNIAQVILKDLLFINGPLINEEMLAARLGIDIKESPSWDDIKNDVFSGAKYKGVFLEGWNRWWMNEVLEIFKMLTGNNLAALDARERVTILKDKIEYKDFKFAEKIEKCNSYRYWTICKGYNRPLDPREGFKIVMSREPKSWQDYDYISLEAILEREGFEDRNIKLHPSEKERVEIIKKSLQE